MLAFIFTLSVGLVLGGVLSNSLKNAKIRELRGQLKISKETNVLCSDSNLYLVSELSGVKDDLRDRSADLDQCRAFAVGADENRLLLVGKKNGSGKAI